MLKFGIFLLLLILCSFVFLISAQCESSQDKDCQYAGNQQRILRRPKRWLTYPEGSSLQLAYDQTIPMVSAQLLFTIGVTIAMAFELPSQPLYYVTKELRENLQILLRGEDIDIPAGDDTKRTDYNSSDLNYIDRQDTFDDANKHSLYYNDDRSKLKKIAYWNRTADGSYFYQTVNERIDDANGTFISPLNKTVAPNFANFITSFVNTIAKGTKLKIPKTDKKNNSNETANVFLRKTHRVFPVFGKRSVDAAENKHNSVDILDDEDLFYLEHHRNSRFEMYQKIENFLNSKKKNGTACVLKSLCETSQRNQNEEKGSFLTEILRVVFSLPEKVYDYKKDSYRHYDDAHQKLEHNCDELYPDCIESFWSPDFVF